MILLSLEGRLLVTSDLLRGDMCMFEGKEEGSRTLRTSSRPLFS